MHRCFARGVLLLLKSATAYPTTARQSFSVASIANETATLMPLPLPSLVHNVTLIWEEQAGTHGHVTIRLQEKTQGLQEKQSVVMPKFEQSSTQTSPDDVPESVLQFERQMRKAQHLKKVGRLLTADTLDVIYKDANIVVVNKPAGVLTVPGTNQHCSILTLVHQAFGRSDNDDKGSSSSIDPDKMIVHRLDMDTSGIVVFGRTVEATKLMHAIFRDRHVVKEYQALCVDHFPPFDAGTIHLPLQRDHVHPPFMRVSTAESEADAQNALEHLQTRGWKKLVRRRPKLSSTEYAVMERFERDGLPCTRLLLRPITGRTHQLRVHCAAVGFPIVGDPSYGMYGEASPRGGMDGIDSRTLDGSVVESSSLTIQKAWLEAYPPNEKPMCLHATKLEFDHPVTGERLQFHVKPEF
jgi:tRNA pseudouridine32 synthase/23S rRNA pseudouridine746 synthase